MGGRDQLERISRMIDGIQERHLLVLGDDLSDDRVRSMPEEQQQAEDSLVKATRGAVASMGEKKAAAELFAPLLEKYGTTVCGRLFHLVQFSEESLAKVLTMLQTEEVSDRDLALLVRAAGARWSAKELVRLFEVWKKETDKLLKHSPAALEGSSAATRDSHGWGVCVGIAIPTLTVQYAKDVTLGLLMGQWERSVSVAELHKAQFERMKGKVDPRVWREVPSGTETAAALDVEHSLAVMGGIYSTWDERWSAEQCGFFFKELCAELTLHCKRAYPSWMDEFAYQMFVGDLIASAALGCGRPRDRMLVDKLIQMVTDGWDHYERQQLVCRIGCRLQEVSYLRYPGLYLYHRFVLRQPIVREKY